MRWLIIIGILGACYLATSYETYSSPAPVPIGTFTVYEFWLQAIWIGNEAVPFASIFAFCLVWLALRMRRGLDDEQRFRRQQRELGIHDEWE